MANKTLFSSLKASAPRATTVNEAGGAAYSLASKHALAQIAATGCFNGSFYSSAPQQLDQVRQLADLVDDNLYLAKLAVYARERAFMKDMPAALLAMLARRDTELMHRVFDRVVDNGRVLRTLLQMIRSGQFGATGLSSSLQRAFQRWLNSASVPALLSASIGNDPSLRDVLRLARPTPVDNQRRALFGLLAGRDVEKWAPAGEQDLPAIAQQLQAYRRAETAEAQTLIVADLPVRWDLLADAARGPLVWKAIARKMGPQAVRMNLNTLLRHEVFVDVQGRTDKAMVQYVADRLADEDAIRRSRQFPYQFLAAYLHADPGMPQAIRSALQAAAETACGNVPEMGPVIIGLDTSGSMSSPVTGCRSGATTKMRCVDVAALFAAAVLRRSPDSVVVPFDTRTYKAQFDPGDTVLSLSQRLSRFGGGGTDCSLPIREANNKLRGRSWAGIVLVSDQESWVDGGRRSGGSTGAMTEWKRFATAQRKQGGEPKLVCINVQAYGATQAPERDDVLNVGGFSDVVFQVVAAFLGQDPSGFVAEVERTEV